jgi:hypothetical protein
VRTALLPPYIFLTNKAPYLVWQRGNELDQAFLLGALASLPLDWYARSFVEVNLNFYILNPFPIPRPDRSNPLRKRVLELVGWLARPDERFAAWAAAVGVECGPLEPKEMEDNIHELDAVVAQLYGLTEAHLRHIFGTFHENLDFLERMEATLEHYRRWQTRL